MYFFRKVYNGKSFRSYSGSFGSFIACLYFCYRMVLCFKYPKIILSIIYYINFIIIKYYGVCAVCFWRNVTAVKSFSGFHFKLLFFPVWGYTPYRKLFHFVKCLAVHFLNHAISILSKINLYFLFLVYFTSHGGFYPHEVCERVCRNQKQSQ